MPRIGHILIALALLACSSAPRASAAASGQAMRLLRNEVPAGLSAADWATIQAEIAAGPYLKASNTGTDDNFGQSVAVSGDTVVVGAPAEASNATGVNGNQANNSAYAAGAVYVFVRSGATWSQQAYLKASNTEANDGFGFSVGVAGGTIVVGAWLEDSSATGINGDQSNNAAWASGAAYLFGSDTAGDIKAFLPLVMRVAP